MYTRIRAFTGALMLTAFASAVYAQEPTAIDWRNVDTLLPRAVDNSPALQRQDAEITASRERAASAGSLPNPMVMGGVQDYMVTFEEDEMMTMYMAGASQTFPQRAKRRAQRDAATLVTDRLEMQRISALAEIERDLHFAYYDLVLADSRIHAVDEVLSIADALIAATRVRYEVGTTIQADVIRAQLARTTLAHDLITLRADRRAAAARLLSMLGMPPETEIPQLSITHDTHDVGADRGIGPARIGSRDNPAIAAEELAVAFQEKELELARLAKRPDFAIEGSYGYRPMQTDMFSVLGRIELPIRRKSVIEPQIRAEAAERDAAQSRVEEVRRNVLRDYELARAVRETTEDQVRLHEEVLVPQSRLAVESGLAAYQAGRDNFESILAALNQYVQLELDFYGFLVEHTKALVDIKALAEGARNGAVSGGSPAMGLSAAPAAGTSANSSMTSM